MSSGYERNKGAQGRKGDNPPPVNWSRVPPRECIDKTCKRKHDAPMYFLFRDLDGGYFWMCVYHWNRMMRGYSGDEADGGA